METLKRPLFLVLIIFNLFVVGGSAYAQDSYLNFDSGLSGLTKQISTNIKSIKTLNIAVIEFSNSDENSTEFSRFLCEELTTKLFQTKSFNVVERSQIDKIIKEQKLQLTGPINKSALKQLGKLTGVDAILTGSIIDMQSYIRINARAINVYTGSITSAASVNIEKDGNILNLLKNITKKQVVTKQTKKVPLVKEDDISFSLSKITYVGKNLACEILVTCSVDMTLCIGESSNSVSRIFSKSGRSFPVYLIYVDPSHKRNVLQHSFMGGVPQIVTFVFESGTYDVFSLYLMTISYYDMAKDRYGSNPNVCKIEIKN